jgi:hypothetical protein
MTDNGILMKVMHASHFHVHRRNKIEHLVARGVNEVVRYTQKLHQTYYAKIFFPQLILLHVHHRLI